MAEWPTLYYIVEAYNFFDVYNHLHEYIYVHMYITMCLHSVFSDSAEECKVLEKEISALHSKLSDANKVLSKTQCELNSMREIYASEREEWQTKIVDLTLTQEETVGMYSGT